MTLLRLRVLGFSFAILAFALQTPLAIAERPAYAILPPEQGKVAEVVLLIYSDGSLSLDVGSATEF